MSHQIKVSEYSIKRSFMTLIIILLVFILLEFVTVFIYCIISEMHIQVIHIAIVWWLILFSRKSGEAFFMPVYTQGIHSIEKSINSQVKLQIINEVRFVDVPLNHTALYLWVFNDSIEISCQEDAPSLREAFRFHYEGLLRYLFVWPLSIDLFWSKLISEIS